jgi:putative transposase
VALEALKGLKTVNDFASPYGVHPTQIAPGKHRLQQELSEIFSARRAKRAHDQAAFHAQLSQQIGQRKVALDWLKKKLDLSPEAKRELLEPAHQPIRSARPCALVGWPRSTSYDHTPGERAAHLAWMRVLAKPATATPSEGVRRMIAW